jgi:hypothetical protein
MKLKQVGYWYSAQEKHFPKPQDFVDPTWQKENRQKIINYLKSGNAVRHYFGFSSCRFNCGARGIEMGTSDLSDGEWMWPEGLFHYIEIHNVRLPDEFIQTMIKNDWKVPHIEDPENILE